MGILKRNKQGIFKDMSMKVETSKLKKSQGGTKYDDALRDSTIWNLYIEGFRDPSIYWDVMGTEEQEQFGDYRNYKHIFRRNVIIAGIISLFFAGVLFCGISYAAYKLYLMSW